MEKAREGYKMTEQGEIPIHWEIEKLEDLFNFYSGISISRDNLSEHGIYYLHYGDIHKKNKNYFSIKEDSDWLPKIDIEVNKLKEELLLNTGDVVFADASEDYEGIGKSVVIINDNNEKFVAGLHTIVAKDKIKKLHTLYKKYCFSTTQVRKQFVKLATGATVYGISRSNIKNIKILVPSIEEQKKIASILSSVDKQIEITDNLIEKTKELKKGLMQRLLTKGIGHSRFKDTELGKIPEEWEILRIKDVGDTISGGTPSRSHKEYYENGTIPWLKTGELNQKYIFDSEEKITEKAVLKSSAKLIPINSVLIAMYGATIGKVSISKRELTTNQACCAIICKEEILSYEYLYYILSFNKENLIELGAGGAQPNISQMIIKEYKIAVPSIKEQEKIATILSSVDEQIEQYELKKEKLQKLKKGLMQKLLTGKIRVKV
ncbi:restriction endonuclease subunit S [Defluviitalea raffinosedens]|uniref:Type I restriction modification DNA specificity domain-containing protein n=1 Tax=Defluviitalea raffinosedens TaxID=1450156 RepID=A0A7C8LG50_9FIRM|nr:restriction endonuclease subunit S [Defluviitalea raffinosedens]KAE9636232.1 hypothetical protein GND95_03690 [Defluviitalea raffinosedens]MBM7685481.1 type I restriction enzyme S subunit [Defluviitalea raffinosedens]